MVKFQIQETAKIKRCSSRCSKCWQLIEHKEAIYRVKYGSAIFHLNCFYTWLRDSIPRLDKRNEELKDCYTKLNGYMPQILAESLTSGK
jgi:hypothetical protein